MVANSKVDKSKVNALAWKSSTEFMTCGAKHAKFWTIQGRNLNAKNGTIGTEGKFDPQLCAQYSKDGAVCFTGGLSGSIYIWNGNSSKKLEAH